MNSHQSLSYSVVSAEKGSREIEANVDRRETVGGESPSIITSKCHIAPNVWPLTLLSVSPDIIPDIIWAVKMAVSHFWNEFCCCRRRFLLADALLTDTRRQVDVDLLMGRTCTHPKGWKYKYKVLQDSFGDFLPVGAEESVATKLDYPFKQITVRVYCSFQLRSWAGCKILNRFKISWLSAVIKIYWQPNLFGNSCNYFFLLIIIIFQILLFSW